MSILSFIKGAENGLVATEKAKDRPVSELVQEIHETFYTEVDRLLVEAGILVPIDDSNKEVIEKMRRLSKLGFINAKDVKQGESVRSKIEETNCANEEKRKLKESILYFQQKYPMYRFITEEGVERICNKYNLVYGPVSNYLGDVPEKNIQDIERFRIDDDDKCVELNRTRRIGIGNLYKDYASANKNLDEALKRYRENAKSARRDFYGLGSISTYAFMVGQYEFEKCPLEIAAPIKDFDTSNMVLSKNKLERKIDIPDPVVLQPVYHNGKKHYLIVTAWGDEASDPEVMNPNHN